MSAQPNIHQLKSIALGGVLALSMAPAINAQTVPQQTLSQRPLATRKFSCGRHLKTFVVRSLNQQKGRGIRCVKITTMRRGSRRIPKISWYGEGNWNGKTYRHIGHAFGNRRLMRGYASDIYGNGEDFKNNFPGNLRVTMITPNRIRVTGAWNEEWVQVRTTRYQPLRRARTCGKFFDQYRVADLISPPQGRDGRGLRCVLKVGPKGTYASQRYFTTWFGNGQWGQAVYSHLGTRSPKGAGASDICGSVFGPVCNHFNFGSLQIKPVGSGFDVMGAWREKWR